MNFIIHTKNNNFCNCKFFYSMCRFCKNIFVGVKKVFQKYSTTQFFCYVSHNTFFCKVSGPTINLDFFGLTVFEVLLFFLTSSSPDDNQNFLISAWFRFVFSMGSLSRYVKLILKTISPRSV